MYGDERIKFGLREGIVDVNFFEIKYHEKGRNQDNAGGLSVFFRLSLNILNGINHKKEEFQLARNENRSFKRDERA